MKITRNLFEKMTSLDHLFQSWDQFRRGKRKRKDVQCFERHLEDNIFQLQQDLITFQYQHASYHQFYVTDPKQRHISKASVRDRLVHQVVYDILNEALDKKFIFHSLSSRLEKGTHIGVTQLHRMIRKISANGKWPCYALKMDIRRFFDSVDHRILKRLLRKNIKDENILKTTDMIIDSFKIYHARLGCVNFDSARQSQIEALRPDRRDPAPSGQGEEEDRFGEVASPNSHNLSGRGIEKTEVREVGIPLGNVTSQLFANVYLHELDDFVKQKLKEKFYLRYCDDFIILSNTKFHLEELIVSIRKFLGETLRLELHPKKVIIKKLSQGIDFVGYVLFDRYVLLRTRTKQRMKRRLKEAYENYFIGKITALSLDQKLQSYLGILSHANQHELSTALKNAYWIRSETGKIPSS